MQRINHIPNTNNSAKSNKWLSDFCILFWGALGVESPTEGPCIISSQQDGEVSIGVERLKFSCTATLNYESGSWATITGSAAARVSSEGADVDMFIKLNSSDSSAVKVPDSVSFRDCRSTLNLKLEVLSGSTWTKLYI